MALSYNPDDIIESEQMEIKPGIYNFIVKCADEITFKTGNNGLKIELSVIISSNHDITVFDNIVYVPKSLWRLKTFLSTIGLNFSRPPEIWEISGKSGTAEFELVQAQDDKKYLKVKKYVTPETPQAQQDKKAQNQPTFDERNPPPTAFYSRDVPF